MYDRILVPMALTHGISAQTLKTAQVLCNPGGQIIALHVFEIPYGTAAAYLGDKTIAEGMETARRIMEEKTAGIEGLVTEVVRGHSYRTIIDVAVDRQVGCIVIGSHRPDLSDYLIGSTAARVVRHAPCPVHVHRDT